MGIWSSARLILSRYGHYQNLQVLAVVRPDCVSSLIKTSKHLSEPYGTRLFDRGLLQRKQPTEGKVGKMAQTGWKTAAKKGEQDWCFNWMPNVLLSGNVPWWKAIY